MLKQKQKEERKKKLVPHFSCKKEVYENCKMLAPDGELLSNCDKKKVQWYIERDLAIVVKEEPLTIKLKFEPNGRSLTTDKKYEDIYDDHFYVVDRKNQCVVCGNESQYSRFHVIPSLYRQHFPDELKSHRSHDVLLLCFECHEKSSNMQEKVKKTLSEQYLIPLNDLSESKQLQSELQKIQKIATTLSKDSSSIPEEKKAKLRQIIMESL